MGSRCRIAAVLASGTIYVASAVACESYGETSREEALDGSTDGRVDQETASDATSDASDAGGDARDASLATICPMGSCRVVFVTSDSYTAKFGGIALADQECEKLAKASARPDISSRSFRAWLSQADAAARDRHASELKPYVRVDGVKVADGWSQLTSASGDAAALQAPIQVDEKGVNVGIDIVWTGTTYLGQPSVNTCTNWTSTNGSGQAGRTDQVNEAWTDSDEAFPPTPGCGGLARLYCFEK